jgi:hypothetical protein
MSSPGVLTAQFEQGLFYFLTINNIYTATYQIPLQQRARLTINKKKFTNFQAPLKNEA